LYFSPLDRNPHIWIILAEKMLSKYAHRHIAFSIIFCTKLTSNLRVFALLAHVLNGCNFFATKIFVRIFLLLAGKDKVDFFRKF
jgi:hypothetical protein